MLSVSDGMPRQSADENMYDPSMSSDGRFVVFSSAATNIGTLGTTSHFSQVYLRDVDAGTTTVISSAAGSPGNGDSDRAVISGDGSTVAFISTATNLTPLARSGIAQVLVWSKATGVITDASVSNEIPNPQNGRSVDVAISDDGKKIVFDSIASKLAGAATFGVFQVYSRDLTTRVTTLESVDPSKPGTGASGNVLAPTISGDGRVIAFATAAQLTEVGASSHFQW